MPNVGALVMALEIVRIPVLSDNYVWLVHERKSGETMVVDPAVAPPVLEKAEELGWKITQIWNTHWHPDHTGGNAEIKEATGCTITGPAAEFARIPTLDVQVKGGDIVKLGERRGEGDRRSCTYRGAYCLSLRRRQSRLCRGHIVRDGLRAAVRRDG